MGQRGRAVTEGGRFHRMTVYLLVAVFLLATLVFDLLEPLGVAAGVPYVIPVLFSLLLHDRRFTLVIAMLASILTVAGFFASVQDAHLHVVLTNRALTVLAIWLTAFLGLAAVHADEQLREREKKLSLIMESVPAMISYIDADYVYRYTNRARRESLPELGRDLVGKSLREVWGEERFNGIKANIDKVLAGEELYFIYEYSFGKSGRRAIDTTFVPHRDDEGRPLGVYVLSNDITHFMDSERALRESQQRLRNLARRLRDTREEERLALSREIHDNLGQMLTALKMELSRLRIILPAAQDDLRRQLRDMIIMTDDIIDSVRTTAMQLRPVMLSDLGLPETVRWALEQFTERNGITHSLVLCNEPLPGMTDEFNTAVYRILQEALTNVVRHARAGHVNVSLRQDESGFHMTVADDGIGMDGDKVSDPESLGVTGMLEYAFSLGGELEFRRGDNGGTVVNLTVPADAVKSARTEAGSPVPS